MKTKPETVAEKTARLKAARLEHERTHPPISERPPHHHRVFDLDDPMPFGKHAGKTVIEILETDPGWLKWAFEETQISFSDSVHTEYSELFSNRRSRRK